MSFILKSSRRELLKSFINIRLFLSNPRSIYDASVFGIKEYNNIRLNAINKSTPGLFNSIKKRLEESIDKNSLEIEQQDLNMFLLLGKNDEDLELILKAFKKTKNLLLIDKDEKFGERFTKLCYALDNSQKLIEALNDEEIRPSLMGQLTSFLIMNRLIIEKKYDIVLQVFDHFMETLANRLKNNERPDSRNYLKKQIQIIPFGHLRLAFEALLNINSKESFNKMQEILKQIEKFKSKPNNTALACCFLLALKQNESNFAYNVALSIEKANQTLINNLKAIALFRLGRIEEGFFFFDTILNFKPMETRNNFEGKFFPDTLNEFKEQIDKLDDTDALKEKYKLAFKEAEKNKFNQDLYGYCTNINIKSKK